MKALLLAAGYGTRLRPLTDRLPKELLPVGGRPIVEWIYDAVVGIPEIDAIHIVTNATKADAVREWAAGRDISVHDDGTTSNEDRLGATGDIRFVLAAADLWDDDLLVIAGDNLFGFALADYISFWRRKGGGSAIAVHRLPDPALAHLYGVVELDQDDRVVALEEKPERPRGDHVSTATYIFAQPHLTLLERYLDEGNPPDPPGRFLTWLCEREPVYGFRFAEEWLDIGDPEQLLSADNLYRARQGLPERDVYSL